MKNTTIEVLRNRLREVFENFNEMSQDMAMQKCNDAKWDDATEALFQSVWNQTLSLINANLADDAAFEGPTDNYYDALQSLFAFPLTFTHANYTVRDDISDEEIAAHADAIRGGKAKELEDLRSQKDRTSYMMTITDSYNKLHTLYRNVQYLLMVLAYHAKHAGTRESTIAFLRAASQLQTCNHPRCVNFSQPQIDTIISRFREGVDAMRVQLDYLSLSDWPSFRKAQAKMVAAANAKGDNGASRTKGAK